jgi:hypothetical protein
VHPEASRELFNEGVDQLQSNKTLLGERGWIVLKAEYPDFHLAVRHRRTGKIRVFAFKCDDWNEKPLSLTLIDCQTLEELRGHLWPFGTAHWHQSGWESPAGLQTSIPFMCMRGIREYHTHKSHVADLWSNYRDQPDCSLANLVLQVTEAFQQANV